MGDQGVRSLSFVNESHNCGNTQDSCRQLLVVMMMMMMTMMMMMMMIVMMMN